MMNKDTLVALVAAQTGQKRQAVRAVLDALPDVIVTALLQGEAVQLGGFVRFDMRHIKSKRYRNPKTGQWSELPARRELHVRRMPSFRLDRSTHNQI